MLGKIIKVIIGLALIFLGAWTVYLWRSDLIILIKGGLGLFLILVGLIALALVAD